MSGRVFPAERACCTGEHMYQMRIYTLADERALEEYADVCWEKHIISLGKFGIKTYGIWKERGEQVRLIALVSYPEGADPEQISRDYMGSEDFKNDMAGFDMENILSVDAMMLEAVPASPVLK